ncbi:ergothioneine biosynthesis protein EgtB [Undibacterium sp. TJN25]|uniref:ergothioneine biosynthesis protein EgtB n=1 Tax=Undibacterium sp. TJN25 TaxID=3413056 RepID=UPI003BF44198
MHVLSSAVSKCDVPSPHENLLDRFQRVRNFTISLVSELSEADASAQSMSDTSPAKWHLAHTTWLFETFVLCEYVHTYHLYDNRFSFLFNSYYEAKGARIPRTQRGLITRPSLAEVIAYRFYVDQKMKEMIPLLPPAALELVWLGCQHEEQHQELLVTDILHLFSINPLEPTVWATPGQAMPTNPRLLQWITMAEGPVRIGNSGDGFSFDCEKPEHTTWLAPHAIADRVVTNREWQIFIDNGGYHNPALWLSDGWSWVKEHAIESPLYWRRDQHGGWTKHFGLDGVTLLDLDGPVRHVSYFEADAYARWAGARLPTEAEWEHAASSLNPSAGVFMDKAGVVQPLCAPDDDGLQQMFGDVWEWTGSAYLSYPGFVPEPGAVGEYNGKFMSGQFVLKGGSCATPRGHVRATYRNFFYPHQRWQFTGVRLAKDL